MLHLFAYGWVGLLMLSHTSADVGYFWQVTDFHYDANYTLHGDPHKMCHYSPSAIHYDLGTFGDYNCDSPWTLILSSISAMKQIHSQPDFIIWTGDSVPHVDISTYAEDKVFNVIRNVTEALISHFNTTVILPSFGNHDPYPTNQMPPHDTNYYKSILKLSQWDELIPASANKTFLQGGYFSFAVHPKLKVICLNTALYYMSNNITKGGADADPSGQFVWLAAELEQAKLAKQKVYVTGHVPPGAFELNPKFEWFHAGYNAKYLSIVDDYTDVIVAHFYGHEHTDSFRVYDAKGEGHSVMFLSPAVTPWKSSLPGVGYNNPSVRLYKYDRNTSDVLDYHQYFLNLSQANLNGTAEWRQEYQFTKAYGVKNLKPTQVRKAAAKIVGSNSTQYLHRYLMYNSVSAYNEVQCNSSCVHIHKCVMLNVRHKELNDCLTSSGHHKHTTSRPHHHHRADIPKFMTSIIIGLAALILILAVAVLILCFRSRPLLQRGKNYGRLTRLT